MTVTVRILIEGNKACSVKILNEDGTESARHQPGEIKPNEFKSMIFSGSEIIQITEHGDFLS
jgi:hypothetical protein